MTVLSCPRCRAQVNLPTSSRYVCGRCSQQFNFYRVVGARATPSPLLGLPADAAAEDGPVCARHPGNRAEQPCERCGDFMCSLCGTQVEGRTYCPGCFDLLHGRGAFEYQRRNFTKPETGTRLAVYSLLLSFTVLGGLALGIAGILMSADALREIGRRPELGGTRKAVTAIVIASLGILGSVAMVAFFLTRR